MSRKKPRKNSNSKSNLSRRDFFKWVGLIGAGGGVTYVIGRPVVRAGIRWYENINPTVTYEPDEYGIVTYRTHDPDPDNETIFVIKDLHAVMQRPYTWKIQSEIHDLFYETLFLKLGVKTVFAEGLINQYHVTVLDESTGEIFPHFLTDWDRVFFKHVIDQASQREKENLMEQWHDQLTNGYYPFQDLSLRLPSYTAPLENEALPESYWLKDVPPAFASLEFVIQDDLFANGIEDLVLFLKAAEIADKMKPYELNGDVSNPEYLDLSVILNDYAIKRNHICADVIRSVVDYNKDVDTWNIPTTGLIIGGSHVDDSYGQDDLKPLLEQKSFNVVVIEPPSYQEVLLKILEDSGFITSWIPDSGLKTRMGWYKPIRIPVLEHV